MKKQWKAPKTLPNIKEAKLLAVDLETCDRGLQEDTGPGGVTGKGYVCGIAVAVDKGPSLYIPISHPDTEGCYTLEQVRRWAVDNLTGKGLKVGANILYDLEWLRSAEVKIAGPYIDVQGIEALLDEQRGRYNLISLTEQYLPEDERKLSGQLDLLGRTHLGLGANEKIGAHIHELPASIVGPYAERDATSTLGVYKAQMKRVKEDKLEQVLDVEQRLIPLLLDMRYQGVRLDTKALDKAFEDTEQGVKKAKALLHHAAGGDVNVNAARSIAKAFDGAGLTYPYTGKSNPSFTKAWLEEHTHPLAKAVLTVRGAEHVLTFLEGFRKHLHDGRLHTQFNALKGDEYGTVSGRFSSSHPNLQQVPKREDVGAELLRSLFVPEPGERWWKVDYSQIEYRLIVHYAYLTELAGAAEAREAYIKSPDTDFHQWVADLMGAERPDAKILNFGLAYGMGVQKLMASLNKPRSVTDGLFRTYHAHAPFMRALAESLTRRAKQLGFIKTLLGRRRRFNLWEHRENWRNPPERREPPLHREAAVEAYGEDIVRAYTYKAMNALIQGSAADLMKLAMVKAYEAGVFATMGSVPSLTVHDELDGSLRCGAQAKAAYRELLHIMRTAIDCSVPILVEAEIGKNWWALEAFK